MIPEQLSIGTGAWTKLIYLFGALCISIRLFYLQIYLGINYDIQSKKNYIRYEAVNATRGQILDCHGRALVTNKPIINLYWNPTKDYLSQKDKETIAHLGDICNITPDATLIQKIEYAQKKNCPTVLVTDISFNQLSIIEEQFSHNQNVLIQTDFKRHYPYKNMASHIIGYLSNLKLNVTGKMGLEKAVNEKLQGTSGTLVKTINSYGKEVTSCNVQKSSAGNDIQITIDITLQQMVEAAFTANYVGTFIVMEPETGAIRALLSRPNFDPTIFLEPLHPHQWQALQENNPFLNRAINCCYPPGSLFKLITICAAIETGVIATHDTHICKGYINYGKRNYWCHRRYGHGAISITQGLALSCNTLFYELGKKLSIDVLADYAHRFGLGQKTGFLLNETAGLIPTTQWKRETKGEHWWPGETLSASIGQSYLLTTPLQFARMISSIFTKYLVKPRILNDEAIEKRPLYVDSNTIAFLKRSMRSVVTEGTGRRVNRIKDIEIYAKTSTAQVSTIDKRNLGQQYFEHGWMVAYFTYKNQNPLTLVILVEHAGTSRIPVLIAKQFLLAYRDQFERKSE